MNRKNGDKPTFKQSVILRILTEEEALLLRARPGVSIGVIVIIPRSVGKRGEVITITEKNARGSYITTKFPSGGLEIGEHPFAGAVREARTETGYEIRMDNIIFACGAEYSTTVPGETHYKICVIAKEHKLIGEPIFDGQDEILSVDWRALNDVEHRIPKAQKTTLQPIMEKLMTLDAVYAFELMNFKASVPFVEGVFQVKNPDKDLEEN